MRYTNTNLLIELINSFHIVLIEDKCLRIISPEDKNEPTRETKQLVHILEEEKIGKIFSKITTRKMQKNSIYTNPGEEAFQEYQPHRKNYQHIPPKGLSTISRYIPAISHNQKTTRKYNY